MSKIGQNKMATVQTVKNKSLVGFKQFNWCQKKQKINGQIYMVLLKYFKITEFNMFKKNHFAVSSI